MGFSKVDVKFERPSAGREDLIDPDIQRIMEAQIGIAVGDAGICARVLWIELYGLGEHEPRQLVIGPGMSVKELTAPQIVRIGFDTIRGGLGNRFLLLRQQLDFQLLDDRMCNLVLDREDVRQVTIVAVGPEMRSVLAIDELSSDPNPRSSLAHASLQNESDTELAADLLNLYGLAFVDECRVTGDH